RALQSKAGMSGKPLRVIVEFEAPAAPAPWILGGHALDAATTADLRGRQAQILSRALGVDPALTRADAAPATLMDFTPMMALEADAATLARLAADPLVKRIVEDRLEIPHMPQIVGLVGMTGSKGAYKLKADGRGRAVAIIDSGVDKSHEFLRRKVISEACYGTNDKGIGSTSLCPRKRRASTAAGSGKDCPKSISGCGHGTHVAGIAAGRNRSFNRGEPKTGIARNSAIVAIKVFSKFDNVSLCGFNNPCILAFQGDIIKGLERVYKLRNGVSGRKIDAVNLSLGGGSSSVYCNSDPRAPIIQKLRDAGIAAVISSGNAGNRNGVAAPGCIEQAVTIGASTKKAKGKPERIASYSNQGPQVDIVAPGGDGGYPFASNKSFILSSFQGGYAGLAGTSMAAPAVSGAFAAIRSRKGCQNKTVDEIEAALKSVGPTISDQRPGGSTSNRRLHVSQAIKKLGCG
ncbi:MAG TPA: S8 family serine peptidase, partial [Methylomirabilota bacterium]|nr:S8 family serine peptidase [Methylomirabilota bacterium]